MLREHIRRVAPGDERCSVLLNLTYAWASLLCSLASRVAGAGAQRAARLRPRPSTTNGHGWTVPPKPIFPQGTARREPLLPRTFQGVRREQAAEQLAASPLPCAASISSPVRRDELVPARSHPDYRVEVTAAEHAYLLQSLLLENRAVVSFDEHGDVAVDDLIGTVRE